MSPMTRITTGSRLHFGLFSVGSELAAQARGETATLIGAASSQSRMFGGVGLMVDLPQVVVSIKPAPAWSAQGTNSERALAFVQRFAGQMKEPFHIEVETCPPEHMGLGTGTQLGLAVGAALLRAAGEEVVTASELARMLGRGQRSALGIHGFAQGGFLVDAGKGPQTQIAPLVARAEFPEHWRVVLVLPRSRSGCHGQGERDAFAQLAQASSATTDLLCRLTLLGMLPAVQEADLPAFGEALYEFNRRVGEMFQSVQGGIYSHPMTTKLVGLLRAQGVKGVGQSSWGPCVFAVVEAERAQDVGAALIDSFGLEPDEIVVARGRNQGASFGGNL